MSKLTAHITVSLDGFVAGPQQSATEPLGIGGEQLHDWAFATDTWNLAHGREAGEPMPDSEVNTEVTSNLGAYIMGRRMFAGAGEWDPEWTGWWGDEPPFHLPVFVLTHHERAPLTLGDTTFTFVNDGIESALAQARAAAGDKDVTIAGGADAINQYIRAGLLEEIYLHTAPRLLGGGERLFDGVGTPRLEIVKTVAGPLATHVKYALTY